MSREGLAMIIPHDLKCGVCGATATHEQCGGLLACDAHIGPGRALEPALGATLTVPADWIRDHTTKKSDAE